MNGWKALGFKTYQDYLASDFWREKREWILKCFHNQCGVCGANSDLQIHHLNYSSVGNESAEDVMVVCRNCHTNKHKEEKENAEVCS